jgi:putative transposon-encoded protein
MTFQTIVKKSGNSGRIIIPVSLVGKKVRVTLEVLK